MGARDDQAEDDVAGWRRPPVAAATLPPLTGDAIDDAEFRRLADNLPTSCWIAAGDGDIVWFNRRWHDYCGTTPAAMAGSGWQSVHDPAYLPAVVAKWTAAIAAGNPFELNCRLRGADGVFRPFLTRVQSVRDATGAVVRWYGTNTEISAQAAAEEALRVSRGRFVAMVDSIGHIVWSAGSDGVPDFFNARWFDFTGLDGGDNGLAARVAAIHPDDRDQADAAWSASIATGCAYDIEYRLRHRDGGYRWMSSRAHGIHNANGAIIRWLGTLTDIDDLVAAREVLARSQRELEALVAERTAALEVSRAALAQAQKMEAVGQLTGGIAHDFNNMLSIVIGSLDLARRRTDDERVTRLIDNATEGARRAAELTAQLLAFARVQPLRPAVIAVGDLAARAAELVGRTIGETICVATNLAPELWPVRADPAQLESAVVNLCVNARDAMPDGGRVTIATANVTLDDVFAAAHPGSRTGDFVILAVSDTGTGMAAEVAARAFEPFFTTKAVGRGTGLGLSQVYGYVKQSGGYIALSSQPGHGTTVRLYLPRSHDPVPVVTVAAAVAGNASAGETVLLVEDDTAVRDATAAALAELGYGVVAAADGMEALARLDARPEIAIVLTDVVMPGMTGPVLAAEIARRRPALPVVFTSGYPRDAGAADGNIELTVAFLAKPFSLDQLAAKVRMALDAER